MRQVLIALLVIAGLAACTATIEPPKAKVVVPAVGVIEQPRPVVVVPAIAKSPGFCPPGQAKKGNC
jgi:hypothetical protein